ncbi:hypothetical protein QTI51_35865 [Variovorax sp. J22G73]|uniref:hypothetical protein n=1 Tax=unclassified Variovorax TaxID=663243 RepID=UPI000D5C540D|nr:MULTISPECIES: hypothetical protein [unclassified Variovorax]MDM0010253.1 hypothetical protein [Variovorax sp. J22R203]MDM0102703.1 hypothetical protein [Variovorax sp. J22G73]
MKPRYGSMLIALSTLFLATAPAWADGTVSFESDIRPLLKARPAFEKFVLGTLKIDDAGSGVRISDAAMPHLGGARMGPYEFRAVWHGDSGDVPVTLIVDTDTKFLDKAGREITTGSLKQAVKLTETFSAIEIAPAR